MASKKKSDPHKNLIFHDSNLKRRSLSMSDFSNATVKSGEKEVSTISRRSINMPERKRISELESDENDQSERESEDSQSNCDSSFYVPKKVIIWNIII